jgi:hypothetical protein
VPPEYSHIEYAAKTIGVFEEELNSNAAHLVPITMGFVRNGRVHVSGLMVGLSSLENEREIKHRRKDVNAALRQARHSIRKGQIPKERGYTEATFYG